MSQVQDLQRHKAGLVAGKVEVGLRSCTCAAELPGMAQAQGLHPRNSRNPPHLDWRSHFTDCPSSTNVTTNTSAKGNEQAWWQDRHTLTPSLAGCYHILNRWHGLWASIGLNGGRFQTCGHIFEAGCQLSSVLRLETDCRVQGIVHRPILALHSRLAHDSHSSPAASPSGQANVRQDAPQSQHRRTIPARAKEAPRQGKCGGNTICLFMYAALQFGALARPLMRYCGASRLIYGAEPELQRARSMGIGKSIPCHYHLL